jgi:hypothetical protein
MDLTELTQVISLGVKTESCCFALGGEGSILFEAGRVVHAELAGRTGGLRRDGRRLPA